MVNEQNTGSLTSLTKSFPYESILAHKMKKNKNWWLVAWIPTIYPLPLKKDDSFFIEMWMPSVESVRRTQTNLTVFWKPSWIPESDIGK